MPKQILIYGPITDLSSSKFINSLNEASELGEDIMIGINSPGGDPQSSFGMIRALQKFENNIEIEVHGKAQSAAAFFLVYATGKPSALDVSDFLFHRAAYPEWIEQNKELFTDDMKKSLDIVNSSLKKAFKEKIDTNKFQEITGVSVNKLFSMDSRLDITLNAKEAKQINLISKINPLTVEKKSFINNNMKMAAKAYGFSLENEQIIQNDNSVQNNFNMTINDLKSKHPDIYADAIEIGIKQERDRIGAYLAYADVDLKSVQDGIKSGEPMGATLMAELTRKSVSIDALKQIEAGSPADISTKPSEINEVEDENKKNIEAMQKAIKEMKGGEK